MNSASADRKAVVKLEHINFSYGKVPALKDFSLEIAPRKLVGVIGPDGVGKSTMLSLISSL
ncbi:MAG: ATP-binding cassette domain-containing protein [Lentisphaeria bacterium]|nr:ATP-binding cassette domain-containing protein [Lentisphaeria bacterium]